jgi:L-amino acid N-acyltransferase YncA
VRPARTGDAEAIARIHAQGIAERIATFQTQAPSPRAVAERIARGELVLVAEASGEVAGWASVGPYDDAHSHYARVREATLYVDHRARRAGAGRALMEALAQAAEDRRYYKLIGKIFTSNAPSLALVRSCGWREVGVHLRHGRLDGEWKDVVVVERLLGEAAA